MQTYRYGAGKEIAKKISTVFPLHILGVSAPLRALLFFRFDK